MASFKELGISAIISFTLAYSANAQNTEASRFDPEAAFCERQSFLLESLDEVLVWIDYVGGLREARTNAPELDCPSATVRAVYDVLASPTEEAALAKRHAFFIGYVSQAMEPESRQRAMDPDGSFRYLNDLTLASFAWMLCPGRDDVQTQCLRSIVEELPDQYLETSPVFCDFAIGPKSDVEWPRVIDELPLTCHPRSGDARASADAWLNEFYVTAR